MVDYHVYKRFAPALLGVAFVLLVMVLLIGENLNGATRWISIAGVTIMPGEIAKICVIIFTAWFLCRDASLIHDPVHGILPLVAIAGILGALIMKQPNMSTAMTIVMVIMAMMFVAGLRMHYFAGLIGVAGVAGATA